MATKHVNLGQEIRSHAQQTSAKRVGLSSEMEFSSTYSVHDLASRTRSVKQDGSNEKAL